MQQLPKLGILSALLISGCALLPDHQAYAPGSDPSQRSELRVYDAGNFQNPGPDAADIKEINGQRFSLIDHSTHSNVFVVDPGENVVTYKCTDHEDPQHWWKVVERARPATFTLQVEPDSVYDLGCRWERAPASPAPSHRRFVLIWRKREAPRSQQ
nr:hypothetical protein [Oceanococcus sp. HetDA_MAG_MS8]